MEISNFLFSHVDTDNCKLTNTKDTYLNRSKLMTPQVKI